MTASYAWYVNSIVQPNETSAAFGGVFATGDMVVCTVITNDGLADSPMGSDSVTIVNNPPVVDNIVLNPNPLYTNTTLTFTYGREHHNNHKIQPQRIVKRVLAAYGYLLPFGLHELAAYGAAMVYLFG